MENDGVYTRVLNSQDGSPVYSNDGEYYIDVQDQQGVSYETLVPVFLEGALFEGTFTLDTNEDLGRFTGNITTVNGLRIEGLQDVVISEIEDPAEMISNGLQPLHFGNRSFVCRPIEDDGVNRIEDAILQERIGDNTLQAGVAINVTLFLMDQDYCSRKIVKLDSKRAKKKFTKKKRSRPHYDKENKHDRNDRNGGAGGGATLSLITGNGVGVA